MIDTHSHLFVEEFDEDLPAVIERARDSGVSKVFMPNIDDTTVEAMLNVCTAYKGYCFPMIGFHPTSVGADSLFRIYEMKKLLSGEHPFVAVGEVGMDLYWDKTFEAEQIEAFLTQIEWSMAYDLPIIIHSREAWDVGFACLKRFPSDKIRGVFHSFSGDETDLRRALSYPHFYIGINGTVTFKKNTLPTLLPLIPLDRLLLEPDSPYLAPTPKRGRRNEPAYLVHTATFIAHSLGLDPDILAEKTARNACRFFGF